MLLTFFPVSGQLPMRKIAARLGLGLGLGLVLGWGAFLLGVIVVEPFFSMFAQLLKLYTFYFHILKSTDV